MPEIINRVTKGAIADDVVSRVSKGVVESPPVLPATENIFDAAEIASVDCFLNTFGESVRYRKVGVADIRNIKAIITRQPIEGLGGMQHGNSPKAIMEIANDATKGILASELDTGGDEIEYRINRGESPQWRHITKKPEGQTAGWIVLEIR